MARIRVWMFALVLLPAACAVAVLPPTSTGTTSPPINMTSEPTTQYFVATDDMTSCTDRLARKLLARLVQAHERSPKAEIRFGAPAVSREDACR